MENSEGGVIPCHVLTCVLMFEKPHKRAQSGCLRCGTTVFANEREFLSRASKATSSAAADAENTIVGSASDIWQSLLCQLDYGQYSFTTCCQPGIGL